MGVPTLQVWGQVNGEAQKEGGGGGTGVVDSPWPGRPRVVLERNSTLMVALSPL